VRAAGFTSDEDVPTVLAWIESQLEPRLAGDGIPYLDLRNPLGTQFQRGSLARHAARQAGWPTSFDMVRAARRGGRVRVGHAGTLDPSRRVFS